MGYLLTSERNEAQDSESSLAILEMIAGCLLVVGTLFIVMANFQQVLPDIAVFATFGVVGMALLVTISRNNRTSTIIAYIIDSIIGLVLMTLGLITLYGKGLDFNELLDWLF